MYICVYLFSVETRISEALCEQKDESWYSQVPLILTLSYFNDESHLGTLYHQMVLEVYEILIETLWSSVGFLKKTFPPKRPPSSGIDTRIVKIRPSLKCQHVGILVHWTKMPTYFFMVI